MTSAFVIIALLYIGILVFMSLRSRRKSKSADDFMMAGSNIGVFLGFMTFAATLFSTFTLMGMPDFFRTHGVGAWIFLALSDGGMIFLIVWFGYHLRRKVSEKGFKGMSGLLRDCYGNSWAAYVYFTGVFIFLVPYVAIQIRGVAIFLEAAMPDALPVWGWAMMIIVVMLIYSEIGGLKAIMYADVLQGTMLLVVVWIIAYTCIDYFGGIGEMFREVEKVEPALLSTPGPKGLFNAQFLIASFFAILMIPVSQPQLSTRLVVMKSTQSTHRMAVAVGIFAILVIAPTVVLGMYGAVKYPDLAPADFISKVLLSDQTHVVAALAIIGLIAAALSTSDSQIFALGGEFRSLLKGDEKSVMIKTRVAMIVFAIASLIFSIITTDQLVLLARVSFAGTSIMAPMILLAILTKGKPSGLMPVITAAALLVFILSLAGIVPEKLGPLRLDLLLLIVMGAVAALFGLLKKE
ncbi:MAG: sodium:solute symporter family protein [Cyclobacteriaceae bacterium]|nr:sodium:solute symporter family protein [Cyclobacteriaceae bacterium]